LFSNLFFKISLNLRGKIDLVKSLEEILQLLRAWYNGHRFTKAELQVYNPFSILNAISQYDFKNYWFETGTPSFLVNLIKERDYPIPHLENLQVREETFSTFDLDNLKFDALRIGGFGAHGSADLARKNRHGGGI
jgi:hypothetical protein